MTYKYKSHTNRGELNEFEELNSPTHIMKNKKLLSLQNKVGTVVYLIFSDNFFQLHELCVHVLVLAILCFKVISSRIQFLS